MNSRLTMGLATAALLASHSCLLAQDQPDVVTSDDIVDALEQPKKPATRSLTRGFGVQARKKVDLNIPFEYNSSELAPAAQQQLNQLGDALKRDELGRFHFEIAGHTDASGGAEYNRSLSERRAAAVRQYLIDHGVDPRKLQSVGRGEDELLLPDEPHDPRNRRVEIRNLGEN